MVESTLTAPPTQQMALEEYAPLHPTDATKTQGFFESFTTAMGGLFSCSTKKTHPPIPQKRIVTPPSLEMMFRREAITIDLEEIPDFKLYLSPNEIGVAAVRPHLESNPGLAVVTGAERLFFIAALRGPGNTGTVGRDIHPHIKAYIDFNTLLLRIAKNREHYVQLSTLLQDVDIGSPAYIQKIKEIGTLMEKAPIPAHMKQYYREYLEDFAEIYFEETKQPDYWRNKPGFEGVKYYEDDALFNRLQGEARSGNIIATVGDISDLRFLDHRNIAILDISNIPDYAVLDIQTRSEPKIITTRIRHNQQTMYTSSFHRPLTDSQKNELDELLRIFRQTFRWKIKTIGRELRNLLRSGDPTFPEVNSCFYSERLLTALRNHKNRFWTCFRGQWVDFSSEGNCKFWAMGLSESDIKGFSLEERQTLASFLPDIQRELKANISDEVRERLTAIQNRMEEGC